MADDRAGVARPITLFVAALAALGWVCAFYALWIDAGNRQRAAETIARLEAENAMLRAVLAPIDDTARLGAGDRVASLGAPIAPAQPGPSEPVRVADAALVALEARSADAQRRLAAANEALDEAGARRAAEERAVRRLEDHVLALRDDLVRLERQTSEARAAAAAAEARRADAEGQARRAAEELLRAREALRAVASRRDGLVRESAAAEEARRAAEAEAQAAQERLARLVEALAETEERLAARTAALRRGEGRPPAPPPPPAAAIPADPAPAPPRVEVRPDGARVIRVVPTMP